MPHYHQHHGRGGMPAAPPRRLITIAISVVSFFILAALAIAQFGPSSSELHARKLAQRIDHAQRANAQFQSRDDTPLGDKYLIGVGKADVTGPVVEIGFGGYADTSQIGSGLRQRLYSRAFIIGETKNPKNRVVYIVLDTLSGDTAVRNGVLDALKGLGDEYAVYGQSNIALTGTHSHSGPGAWLNYLLPQITTLGFSKQSYQAIVDGTVLSIKRAHESLQEGYLDIGTTDINDGNANRSPSAYLANPESERAKYPFNTDKTLTLLRFRRASDLKSVGVLTWYPVHGTSVYQNNTLVNGDNKGVAAYLFEQSVKGDSRAADGFVAGFSQANVGDTTPNTLGAFCDDGSGAACDFESSTCANGKVQACRGRGPFFQKLDKGVSSCYEIGRKQYAGAKNVWTSLDSSSTPVVGSTVRSFHYFHDMRYYKFNLDNGTEVQTCPAALGHSFAAGTTDGPGAFDFTQGDSGAPNNPFWSVVGGLLRVPSASQKACQKPKPILLDVGEMDLPYPWTPNIIDVQTLRVGQFFMIISPSEATTMSGRRWRDAVKTAAKAQKLTGSTAEPVVVLGGPANTYSHYVTTPEEYAIQRYEGASTLFGQYTLPAYINLTLSALPYLSPSSTSSPPPGPSPPDNRDKSLSFITGVVYDGAPPSKPFGTCITQPSTSYTLGSVVTAVFQGANPRNNLRLEGTFVAIEKLGADGKTWTQVRNDEDWDLTYEWKRTNGLLGYSEVTVRWETRRESNGEGADEGGRVYRVRYWGDAKKAGTGKISAFEGTSRQFRLT